METEEQKKKTEEIFEERMNRLRKDTGNLIKWVLLAVMTGLVVGSISSLFASILGLVTDTRKLHGWLFYLLPLAGLLIVFLYDKFGQEDRGTNQVFSSIRSADELKFRSAPMIFISTVLTHLTGGSAGREGAALQLGGSIGNQLARWVRLDEEDRHVLVMCGMSAAFAAVFGTPMAAAVFSMEVISVGIMYYSALLPCMVSALVGANLAPFLGIHGETFHIADIPVFTVETAIKIGVVGIGCGAVGTLFCVVLREVGKLYGKYLKNKYIRVIAASALIIGITALLDTTDFMGAGNELIIRAVEEGQAEPFAFLLKILFTALTMKAGFRGGEIVPSFCIGATFGCVLGQLLSISPAVCAACGMAAVFCSVTNCPLTSILIAFELFGYKGVSFFLIAIVVSYAISGNYSLYKSQTILYSKYKAKYVNERTHT